jgi:hypothetical protein
LYIGINLTWFTFNNNLKSKNTSGSFRSQVFSCFKLHFSLKTNEQKKRKDMNFLFFSTKQIRNNLFSINWRCTWLIILFFCFYLFLKTKLIKISKLI